MKNRRMTYLLLNSGSGMDKYLMRSEATVCEMGIILESSRSPNSPTQALV
jgi:hypothetical protein